MRLPKVLAIAVGTCLTTSGASTLALSGHGSGAAERSVSLADAAGRANGPHLQGKGEAGRSAGPPAASGSTGGASGSSSSGSSSSAASAASGTAPTGSTTGNLFVPAAAVPLSNTVEASTAASARTSAPQAAATAVKLPVPTSDSLPPVSGLKKVQTPDAVVLLNAPLTPEQITALPKLKGITAIEAVDTGTVQLGGAPVVAFGVDPGTFRAFTPAASAASDQLWQYLAGGSLVSSYDMARDRSLKLGSPETIEPAATSAAAAPVQGWLGAFASLGLPGVDLLVAHNYASSLQLVPNSGLVVSAPNLAGSALQKELQDGLPGSTVELLHADQVSQSITGNTIDGSVRAKIIAAALSRVGLPYVWGATGPDSFDCSGLVQWAYRQAGVLMPRVAAEQFLTGDHIPLSAAQPGDLLFWTYDPADPGYVDHVAIYLGNGLMVVAPHTGLDVQVVNVPTADFAGAVAVVLKKS